MSRPRPFPGPLQYEGPYHKLTLTEEQVAWLRRYFPTTMGITLRRMMGVSLTTFYRILRELGIRKSDAVRARIWRAASKKGVRTCQENGYYDSLRGRKPSQQAIDAARKRWERIRNGEIPGPWAVFRQEHPKLYKQIRKQVGEKRKALIRREKFRLLSGMRQETKLRNIVLKPYTRSQVSHRSNALRRGYWFYEDYSEQGGERYNIYYDADTRRSSRFERNLIADGFNVIDGSAL